MSSVIGSSSDLLAAFIQIKQSIELREGDVIGFDEKCYSFVKKKYDTCVQNRLESGAVDDTDAVENEKMADELADEIFRSRCIVQININLSKLAHGIPFAIFNDDIRCNSTNLMLSLRNNGCNDDQKYSSIGYLTSLSAEKLLMFGNTPNSHLEIDATDIKIDFVENYNVEGSVATPDDIFLTEIKIQLRQHLFQENDLSLDLHLHKLFVHSSNNQHLTHAKDNTIHDPRLFMGTVFVCLPCSHEGGDLTVYNGDNQHTFSFSEKSSDISTFQYVAFHKDCTYNFQPVTTGHCILLKYLILRTFIPSMHTIDVDTNDTFHGIKSTLHNAHIVVPHLLNNIYEIAQSTTSLTYFGIFTAHDYIQCGLRSDTLRGVDKIVYDYFHAKDIPISLLSVVCDLKYKDIYQSPLNISILDYENDLHCKHFAVRLIATFHDERVTRHKHIPINIPIFTPWKQCIVELNQSRECIEAYDGEVRVQAVECSHLASVMLIGPILNK